jgi:hypothetical protein
MQEQSYRKRKGGSLVFPIILIVLGVLFLFDNLNITSGIDWGTIWKLWPIILIALGLEIILGRRVSFGAVFLVVIIVVIAGGAVWWSVVAGDGERTTEHLSWPANGVERAELELNLSVGELQLGSYSDMSDLMVADLELAPGAQVSDNFKVDDDVARGWIVSEKDFFSLPAIFGDKHNSWDLLLNSRVRWELDVESGAGDVRIDLSDLRVGVLNLHSGVGSVNVTLPRRGSVKARVDSGVGDLRITIPEGAQARIRVDRGVGDLNIAGRFKRRGDYYETEDFSRAESYIELDVDMGVGSITIR